MGEGILQKGIISIFKIMNVSIIIPTLNEEIAITHLLQQLQSCRELAHEVIVVDGGSKDQTVSVAESFADKVIQSEPGRALQMNKGAAQASGDVYWFVHADTVLPDAALVIIQAHLKDKKNAWGRFNIKLSGSHFMFRIIERMMNLRSCISGIATGDQGIFVKRTIFEQVGGYAVLPLMEDIELSKKLKKISPSVCVKNVIITSSRRWEEKGILRTVLLMWRLRFLYWLGVSADKLARQYR